MNEHTFDAPEDEESNEEEKRDENDEENYSEILTGDDWKIPPDVKIISPAADELDERLTSAGWSEDDLYQIDVGFRECLANAIKYGKSNVEVQLEISPEKITIVVSDGGEGFNPDQIPDPRDAENLDKTSGRGIFFMKKFFDSVSIEARDPGTNRKGTKVTLIKKKKE